VGVGEEVEGHSMDLPSLLRSICICSSSGYFENTLLRGFFYNPFWTSFASEEVGRTNNRTSLSWSVGQGQPVSHAFIRVSTLLARAHLDSHSNNIMILSDLATGFREPCLSYIVHELYASSLTCSPSGVSTTPPGDHVKVWTAGIGSYPGRMEPWYVERREWDVVPGPSVVLGRDRWILA
jgi:hypothetical protein